MNEKDAALTRARKTVSIGGKSYHVKPLSDRDIVELDDWLRQRHIKLANDVAKTMSRRDGDRIIELALKQTITMSWQSELGRDLLASLIGVTQLFYQAQAPNVEKDRLTYEQCYKLMQSPEAIQVIHQRLIIEDMLEKKGPSEGEEAEGEEAEGEGSQE